MGLLSGLETQVIKWLLNPEKIDMYKSIVNVAITRYSDVLISIQRNTCPFCGKRFGDRQSLIKHLTHSRASCRRELIALANKIIDEAREERNRRWLANRLPR